MIAPMIYLNNFFFSNDPLIMKRIPIIPVREK